MAPEHGETRQKPGQGTGKFSFRTRALLENTYLRITVEDFQLVRGCLDVGGEVLARVVALHVKAAFPQFALRHIDDLVAVSDIHRFSVLAVELCEFFRGKLFDGSSPPCPYPANIRLGF
jgi:hypothetical protein